MDPLTCCGGGQSRGRSVRRKPTRNAPKNFVSATKRPAVMREELSRNRWLPQVGPGGGRRGGGGGERTVLVGIEVRS